MGRIRIAILAYTGMVLGRPPQQAHFPSILHTHPLITPGETARLCARPRELACSTYLVTRPRTYPQPPYEAVCVRWIVPWPSTRLAARELEPPPTIIHAISHICTFPFPTLTSVPTVASPRLASPIPLSAPAGLVPALSPAFAHVTHPKPLGTEYAPVRFFAAHLRGRQGQDVPCSPPLARRSARSALRDVL
jgi:hypothetical protein